MSASPVVTAIVSIYNCERFIRGCLDDLLDQTLGESVEILCVDTGSEQGEREIVADYQRSHPNIEYLRVEQRETIYSAWTRGCKAARGRYITNANADDRHRGDALEVMARALDANPDVALVYADSLITSQPNQTYNEADIIGRTDWPRFDRKALFTYNYIGPHPMWRKSVHADYGYFDRDFRIAGDYDFWLRLAAGEDLLLIKEPLGLYFLSPDTAERRNKALARDETILAKRRNRLPRSI